LSPGQSSKAAFIAILTGWAETTACPSLILPLVDEPTARGTLFFRASTKSKIAGGRGQMRDSLICPIFLFDTSSLSARSSNLISKNTMRSSRHRRAFARQWENRADQAVPDFPEVKMTIPNDRGLLDQFALNKTTASIERGRWVGTCFCLKS
jgi:hypothetical protein